MEIFSDEDRWFLKRRRWLLKRHPSMSIYRINRLALGKIASPGFRPKNKWLVRHLMKRRRIRLSRFAVGE